VACVIDVGPEHHAALAVACGDGEPFPHVAMR
jgi:hypothetical protein